MKIDRIETFILTAPLGAARFYYSQASFTERSSLIVRITTGDGLAGWGESGVSMPVQHVATYIHDILAPRVLGRDPRATEPLWHELYSFSRDFGRKATPIDAMSGIDIALWDIRGKEAGRPIHALLGGAFRDAVRPYATGLYYVEDDLRDIAAAEDRVRREVESYLDAGFTAIKGKVGLLSIAGDARRMEAARETAGYEICLMADANHAYNRPTARRLAKILERLDFHWFEEPVVPEDIEGLAGLRRSCDIAIVSGECEYTRHGMFDLLRAGAVDVLQPDLAACGGISEGVKIAALASAFHTPVIPHVWGSGVAVVAALQFIATLPPAPHTAAPRAPENEPLFEFDRTPNPLRDELLAEPISIRDGMLSIPQGPGLGIEVNMEALERHCAARRESRL